MGKFKLQADAAFIKAMLLFSIFTLFQHIEWFDAINRIWIAVFAVIMIWDYFVCKLRLRYLVVLAITLLLHPIAWVFTEGKLYNANMLFYFAIWIMVYCLFGTNSKKMLVAIEKSQRFINGILFFWTVIVLFSAFLPSSYDTSHGSAVYFDSLAGTGFRLMPTVLIISALTMYMSIKTHNRKYDLYLVMPIYCAFMGESRTYFGVFICFLVMYLYMRLSKKRFLTIIIPFVIVVLLLIGVTGVGDKIALTQYTPGSYFDFWATVTSGRTLFWKYDLDAFFALPFWQQFVGNGFNFVFQVNEANGMGAIWGHNDYINILMNFGYIGLWAYLAAFIYMYNHLLQELPKKARLPKLILLFAVFFNSFFNMSYTYLCAMLSYPLFMCVIYERYHIEDSPSSKTK